MHGAGDDLAFLRLELLVQLVALDLAHALARLGRRDAAALEASGANGEEVDPRVKGVITVYSEQPVTVREAYLNYLAALRGLGFTVVEVSGLLKVLPEPDAKLQAAVLAANAGVARVRIGDINAIAEAVREFSGFGEGGTPLLDAELAGESGATPL